MAVLTTVLLGLGATQSRAEIPDRALDAQLAQLDRFGYNEPGKAGQQLRALLAEPAHAPHRLHIEYTLGRNAVQAGRPEEVRRIARELEAKPGAAAVAHAAGRVAGSAGPDRSLRRDGPAGAG
ncbi:hypothetical protein ACFJIX_08515 [Roseateles sp. UC29_93]|uniref:hypothetical protein n=1 Tax=Roseateles sp. UC29_93 TaxID=3350177 RepID=UPI0036725894